MATSFSCKVISGRKMNVTYEPQIGCGELDVKLLALSYCDGGEIKRNRNTRGPSDTESAYRAALHHYFTHLTDE
jgi:hypothetical protein